MRNAGLNFVCRTAPLTVENSQSLFTAAYGAGEMIHIPVAHHDGNYFADPATLDRIEGKGRVAFRYRSEEHTSELQSLMRTSYAVFCLKKKTHTRHNT